VAKWLLALDDRMRILVGACPSYSGPRLSRQRWKGSAATSRRELPPAGRPAMGFRLSQHPLGLCRHPV